MYGEADVIARVETPSIQALHDLVMDKIQNLPSVKVTRTFIMIPSLYEEKSRAAAELALLGGILGTLITALSAASIA